MENTKKLTEMEKLEMIKEYVADNEMLMEYVEHKQQMLLNKKNKKSASELAKQEENNQLLDIILEDLEMEKEPISIKELQAKDDRLSVEKYSNQKISALMTKLKNAGQIIRTEKKRVAYFSIAREED